MQVFITGGTGFIGSAIIRDLVAAGHAVTGLARTSESAAKLTAAGAKARRGELTDPVGLQAAVADADAVIHCAFIHDFANFADSVRTDLHAIEAMLDALAAAGGAKIFVSTSGTAVLAGEQGGSESDAGNAEGPTGHRVPAERATLAAANRGVRSAVLRLPPSVHGPGDHGFVPILVDLARKTGVSAYIGSGDNRWPAVHRDDAASLYRLAVQGLADGSVPAGSVLHGVADTAVPFRDIAGVIAERLGLGPAESRGADHFDWFAMFAGVDNPVSAITTEQQTGWQPTRPGLLSDLRGPSYDDVFGGSQP
ncbi:MAG: SDR family oxidoreductase [Cytophagales bacterium]|nr:SDR family oxidoreductase [Armatimonadota bacterium]